MLPTSILCLGQKLTRVLRPKLDPIIEQAGVCGIWEGPKGRCGDDEMGLQRHCAYAYWLKGEAGINILIANRGNGLK